MKHILDHSFDYQKLIEVFDELPLWSAPFGLKLFEHINYRKNISALDIGFGAGFPLTELAMRLGPGSKVYGIDPWKEAVERARKKIEYYDIHNVEIFECSAEKIPLSDQSIDLVTSNNGINNIEDYRTVYEECYRIMKSGAQFVQTMNTGKSMFEFYDILSNILQELNLFECIDKMNRHIYDKRKPVKEIINALSLTGFNNIDVIEDQFSYQFTDGTAMLHHYFMRLAFLDSWKKLLPENMTEQIFLELEKRMNMLAQKHGSLMLSIPFVLINCQKI